MSSNFNFKLKGLEDIQRKMQQLANDKALTQATKRSTRKAMRPVLKSAKINAQAIDDPETREQIFQNLSLRTGRTRDKNLVLVRVGVAGGAKAPAENAGEFKGKGKENKGGDTFYWRFIEFGTRHIPATPFMRPALENNAENVLDEFQKAMKHEIEKELSK